MNTRSRLTFRVLLFSLLIAATSAPAAARIPVVVDTDAGLDDLIAIAFLLTRADVDLQAVTVVNGMARPDRGARNICRLLALAGRDDIPVFAGSTRPLPGSYDFPADLRRLAEGLPGINLPGLRRPPAGQSAANILADTLSGQNGLRILALGPLANLADAIRRLPRISIRSMTIAEGEWNLQGDPEPARVVCGIRNPIVWVSMESSRDATLDKDFLSSLEERAGGRPLGAFVHQVLSLQKSRIEMQPYFSSDLLAAVVTAVPSIAQYQNCRAEAGQDSTEGQIRCLEGGKTNAKSVSRIDTAAYRKLLLDSFSR